jgi:hypothetical protein
MILDLTTIIGRSRDANGQKIYILQQIVSNPYLRQTIL